MANFDYAMQANGFIKVIDKPKAGAKAIAECTESQKKFVDAIIKALGGKYQAIDCASCVTFALPKNDVPTLNKYLAEQTERDGLCVKFKLIPMGTEYRTGVHKAERAERGSK